MLHHPVEGKKPPNTTKCIMAHLYKKCKFSRRQFPPAPLSNHRIQILHILCYPYLIVDTHDRTTHLPALSLAFCRGV